MPTVISTERDKIRTVVARWKVQYPTNRSSGEKLAIGEKLAALDPETATAEDVKQIIGNDSWTTAWCDECESSHAWTVRIGQETDYESSTVTLCRNCAQMLLGFLTNHIGA